MKRVLFYVFLFLYIYLFYLYLKKDVSPEPSKFIIEQDSMVLHKGIFTRDAEERSVYMRVWENDSVEIEYTINFVYDSFKNNHLNLQSVRVRIEDHAQDTMLQKLNLRRVSTFIDTTSRGLIERRTTYKHSW